MKRTLLVLAVGLVVAACADPPVGDAAPAATGDASNDAPVEWSGATRNVPGDYPTIQSAVDAADPGDLVLVDRGVYRETVSVSTPGLTIRGVDRNEVIIDGEFERFNGVEVLFADGVVVENMTSMNHTINGFFWTGVRGYRGSYLTAVNNGDYGIYAFDSGDGLFENSYASGSPDASFYIGQCNPCDAVIRDSVGSSAASATPAPTHPDHCFWSTTSSDTMAPVPPRTLSMVSCSRRPKAWSWRAISSMTTATATFPTRVPSGSFKVTASPLRAPRARS